MALESNAECLPVRSPAFGVRPNDSKAVLAILLTDDI